MSEKAKIHLSKFERELIINKEIILTKRAIIKKVYDLFGSVHESYEQVLNKEKNMLSVLSEHAGKISKGENYEDLPYVIMDYPALFSKEKIIAVRTMFWWGNFFSLTLHLAGKEFKIKEDFLMQKDFLEKNNFHISINENQWQHHFEPSNYIHASKLDESIFTEMMLSNFFKISKKIEVNRWDEVPDFFEKTFNEICQFVSLNFPNGKTVL